MLLPATGHAGSCLASENVGKSDKRLFAAVASDEEKTHMTPVVSALREDSSLPETLANGCCDRPRLWHFTYCSRHWKVELNCVNDPAGVEPVVCTCHLSRSLYWLIAVMVPVSDPPMPKFAEPGSATG